MDKTWEELTEVGKQLYKDSKNIRLPGELSTSEFAKENNISRDMAREILKRLVEANLISVRVVGMYKFYSPKK